MYRSGSIKLTMLIMVLNVVFAINSFAANIQKSVSIQQDLKNAVTETFKVSGNCGMCKKNIETAANKKGIVRSDWNIDTKVLSVTYNSKKTNTNDILKRVAYAGYDNEKFLSPEEAYNKLHGCCKYERVNLVEDKKEPMNRDHKEATTHDHKEATAHDHKDATHSDHKETVASTPTVNPLSEVYADYFALKDALIANDGATAASKSKDLYKAIDKVPMDKLSSAEHNVWMKYMSKLSYDAEHIKGVTETEHQREHFNSLSNNLFEVMKVIKPAYSVYLDHCPMYNDGKGANWISKESVIKNPFYGSKMLTCGKVTETLK